MAINVETNMIPNSDDSIDLGSSSKKFANVYGYNLQGTASTAKYADLAEKYTCRGEPATGSVMVVAREEEVDAEASFEDLCEAVIGVISEKPAYLMNSDSEGKAVAFTGRVPVRIKGSIRKRDYIVPTTDGCARAALTEEEKRFNMGMCLESKQGEEEGMAECIVKYVGKTNILAKRVFCLKRS